MKIKFLGHAAVMLTTDSEILIDPFMTNNPLCDLSPSSVEPDAIILTHGHGDHIGDTIEIARRTGCAVYAMAELSRYLNSQGVKTHGFNSGGSFVINNSKIKVVQAIHSSSCPDGSYGGLACGFIVEYKEKTFYHAGDTDLFTDMKLIGENHSIDVAMLPIGGNYTMDASDAAKAARLLSPGLCIPMHYNTFPLVKCDPDVFCSLINASGVECKILAPGESIII